MNDLSPPYPPDVLDPVPHTPPAGNTADDDGQVIDDTLEPNPNLKVDVSAFPGHLVPDVGYSDGPKGVSRLITRSVPLNSGSPPLQLFPADPNRKRVRVRALSAGPSFGITAPGAGLPLTYVVPAGAPRKLLYFSYVLVTSAVVATRTPLLGVYHAAISIVQAPISFSAPGTQLASLGFTFIHGFNEPSMGASDSAGTRHGYMEPATLWPGDVLKLTVTNLDVADSIVNIAATLDADSWRVAGDHNNCMGAGDMRTDMTYESENHTGPVFVYAPNALDSMVIIGESESS